MKNQYPEEGIDPAEFKRLEHLTLKNALKGKQQALERFALWTSQWSVAKAMGQNLPGPPQEWMDALEHLKSIGAVIETESEPFDCPTWEVAKNSKEIFSQNEEQP